MTPDALKVEDCTGSSKTTVMVPLTTSNLLNEASLGLVISGYHSDTGTSFLVITGRPTVSSTAPILTEIKHVVLLEQTGLRTIRLKSPVAKRNLSTLTSPVGWVVSVRYNTSPGVPLERYTALKLKVEALTVSEKTRVRICVFRFREKVSSSGFTVSLPNVCVASACQAGTLCTMFPLLSKRASGSTDRNVFVESSARPTMACNAFLSSSLRAKERLVL